jgi:uncharacterized protein
VPEYLAPGVYVEETSFRAKSIEGVSTTTTGFVGPTRRGPVAHNVNDPADEEFKVDPLEVITSFGDFQRMYGDFDDLDYGTNYMAHAVRSFFDNGGSRLYVARVYSAPTVGDGIARSPDSGNGLRWIARSPGGGGNGRVRLFPHFQEARSRSMSRAPEGTTLRTGGQGNPATAGRLTGGVGPFRLPRAGRLTVRLNTATPTAGPTVDITITGQPAELIAGAPVPGAVDLAGDSEADRTLSITVDGATAAIVLNDADGQTPAQIVDQINNGLIGGNARLEAGALVITSDREGTTASVSVDRNAASAAVGFSGAGVGPFTAAGSGNVPNINNVTIGDLDARINAVTTGELRASSDTNGNLVLTTDDTGTAARVTIVAAGGAGSSVHALLGFSDLQTNQGTAGSTIRWFVKRGAGWQGNTAFDFGDLDNIAGGAEFVTLGVVAEDADGLSKTYDDLGLATGHPRFVGTVLSQAPTRRADQLQNVFALLVPSALQATSVGNENTIREYLLNNGSVDLTGGADGNEPAEVNYSAGLRALRQVEGISIVAAPGSSTYAEHQGIQGALITHAEQRRAYRIAVLDTRPGIISSEAQTEKSRLDSTYAALYYPWVVVNNPLAKVGDETIPREIALPPSGFVCGIYARNDINRGVYKAPANEIVRGALRYDIEVNFAQQEILNPQGVNCLRFFPGRGNRVWGARTTSSDPEWKYVNVRRYFNYLERSIDIGTQWAVFEPNGERLWANIRETVSSFLVNEWRSGALLGATPKEAFFVRCDRSTMDQNDLDNGRLICLIGVAVVKPAEFVIFRIGQKTADARS